MAYIFSCQGFQTSLMILLYLSALKLKPLTGNLLPGKLGIRIAMRLQKTKLFSHIILGFVLYLLIFSTFALFHAYANDELSDPQGCQIGLWVQHGQQTLLADFVLVPYLPVLFQLVPDQQSVFPSSGLRPRSARAPPTFFFL